MSTETASTSTRLEPIVMLPCPFCGQQPHGVFGPNEETGLWRVECFGNNYGCGDWTVEADSRDEVREAWNRRDWQGMTRQATAFGFLQGILQGLRIGIDDERAKIIDAALSDERYFAT